MPQRIYERTYTNPESGRKVVHLKVHQVWYNSPHVKGKLALRANPSTRQNARLVNRSTFGPIRGADSIVVGTDSRSRFTGQMSRVYASLLSETYGRLRGRLYKGSAALGVTMASYKQSQEMIVSRYRQMTLQADSFERRALSLTRMRKGRKRALALDKLASQYLEMVFGWQPLLADVHAACRTVIHQRPASHWVSANASTYVEWVLKDSISAAYLNKTTCSGILRVNRTTLVTISNPNAWLRERAGLNNPLAVAWDLVPMSFVVNMFVNTGQLVNSITDFAGLTFTNGSTTQADDLSFDQTAVMAASPPYGGTSSFITSYKHVTLGAVDRPPIVFKLPQVNWELAAIAASLFMQKFRSVDRLVNFTLK